MDQHSNERARAAADSFLSAAVAARRAEADKLLHLAELAESYSCHDPEVFVEVLVEGFVRIGGDGTPSVSEFLSLEAAGLMGCSPSTAAGKLADVLDLKHRHQFLWRAVQELELEHWKALWAAHRCRALDMTTADRIANTWLKRQEGLPWSAAKDLLEQLIVALDPDAAAQKEALALTERKVNVFDHQHGTLKLTARLSALDARYLDAAVEQIAGVLERIHLTDDDIDWPIETKNELRSAALGILAHPAYALALLQQDAQQPLVTAEVPNQPPAGLPEEVWQALLANPPEAQGASEPPPAPPSDAEPLTKRRLAELLWEEPAPPPGWALPLREPPEEEPSPVSPPAVDAGGEHPAAPGRRPPCCCGGHTCGTITVPLSKLRPTAQVIVHLNSADLIAHGQGNPRGSAWIEQAGHVTIETLTRMLRHSNVTVKPVVDLNELPTEDRYAPSAALREAVEYLFPVEAFPFATRSSQGLQQDHTSPWGTGPFSGKTELRNLAPLGVKVHNAKTAGYWTTRQVRPGQLWWRSPLGYQYLRSAAGTTRLDDHHLYASVCRPGP